MLVMLLVMVVVRGTKEELGRGTAITATVVSVLLRSARSLLDWSFAQVNQSGVRDDGMRHGIKGQLGLRLVLELRQRGGSCGCEAIERESESASDSKIKLPNCCRHLSVSSQQEICLTQQ